MRLPPWDWKNPFGISTEKLDHYGERKEEVVSLLDKCGLKHTQLEIIWNRLGDDIDAFESHLDLIDKYARLGEGNIELTETDEQLDKQFHRNSRPLNLDYDDFLIHTRILLDLIAQLTRLILNDNRLSSRGFNQQRKFLLKINNIPYSSDEEYAAYVREEILWFKTLLKEYRDNFVIHDRRYVPYGIVSGPRTVPRMNRTVRAKNDVGRTTSRKQTNV